MTATRGDVIASARVVIEGLAVAGIIWLASSVTNQNLAIARLQTQVATITSYLASVPTNTRDIAQLQTAQADQARRLDRLEAQK